MRKSYTELISLLDLKRYPVGIRFIQTEEEYDSCSAQQIKYKIPYCVMIRAAVHGHRIKVTSANFGCSVAKRALGFSKPGDGYYSGRDAFDMGLYASCDIGAEVNRRLEIVNNDHYGMVMAPLDQCEVEPDVVVVITDAFNAMRILQGHNYSNGRNVYGMY